MSTPDVPVPTICRMVIYTDLNGSSLPAIVHGADESLACTLTAFTGDMFHAAMHFERVQHANPPVPHSWRWPPRVP